ncbi:hypothetical protein CMV_012024 [Castanea mollissima]|uniref:Retrotransposon Copia-like N-terminal domain-containing protein n=1 Tax=Castanea mollissima TaxID=60419 RepID=A0A8J4VWH0_9ROSI|nr:hypothetical protein CMV_012024 [Castanea mollissima]
MSSMMTVKLDYSNYVVWKHQIEVILETYSMIDVISDTVMAPDQFLRDSSSSFTTEVNPDFLIWRNREQALFTFLNSTLFPFVLALIVGQESSRGVWKVLEKCFASISRSSVMSLRNELSAVKKGTDSIDVYFQRIKKIHDRLASVSVILDDEELLHIALNGLPSNYDSFSSAIRTRSDVLIVEELNTLLNVEERAIRKRFGVIDTSTMAMAANYQPPGFGRGRGRNNAQRGRANGGRGSNSGGGFHPNAPNAFSSPFSQSQPIPPRPSGP